MLAAEVPAHVHQFDGVERALAAPGRSGGVSALALEHVLDADQTVLIERGPPGNAEVGGHMGKQADIDVLEHAVAYVVRLGADKFLGHSRPQPERAGEMLALHQLLHGDGRDDVEGHPGIMAFAVFRRRFNHRLVPTDTGLLRRLRDVVDIAAEGDYGLAGSPTGYPRGGDAGDAALDCESLFFEDAAEVLGGFKFLEAQFAEAEHAVHHDLRLFLHAVNLAGEVRLHGGFFFGSDFWLPQESECTQGHEHDDFPHRT